MSSTRARDSSKRDESVPQSGGRPRRGSRVTAWQRLYGAIAVGLIGLTRYLPHRAVGPVGRTIGLILYHTGKRNRTIAEMNIERIYGSGIGPDEKASIIRHSFGSVGMAAVEMLQSTRWRAADFESAVKFDGIENWQAAIAAGKGVVAVSAHFGSWELRNNALLFGMETPVNMVAVGSGNASIDAKIRQLRETHGLRCYRYGQRALGYVASLRRNGVVAFLIDRGSRKVRRAPVTFLGAEVVFPSGFAHLSRRTGAAVLPNFMIRDPRNPTRHRLLFTEPLFPDPALDDDEDIQRITDRVVAELEAQILAHPEQWAWMLYPWYRGRPKRRRKPGATGPAA